MRRLNWAALIGTILAALSLNSSPSRPPLDSTPAPEITWTAIFGKAPPPASRPPGGSRGNDEQVYAIAPGQIGRAEVWHDQPLFVWQGSIRQIELVTATGTVWSQAVTATTHSIAYPGPTLQPGRTYEWIIYNLAKVPIARVAFRIMAAPEREQIAADLAELTAQFTAQFSDATPEQIALQRANYFADRQLWTDVLQEAFAVTEPSSELVRIQNEITATVAA